LAPCHLPVAGDKAPSEPKALGQKKITFPLLTSTKFSWT